MADVTIDASVGAGLKAIVLRSVVETDKDTIYVFYPDSTTNIFYRKSTDGGATWGSTVTVYAGNTVECVDIHADWWTPGDLGTKVYIAWMARTGGTSTREYRSLDTDGDTLGTAVSWHGAGGVNVANGWHDRSLTIWKSRANRLHIHAMQDDGAGDQIHAVSTDGGATWDSTLTPVATSTAARKCIGLPGNESSFNDVWLIHMDSSAVLKISVYDFGANSWVDTTIASLTTSDPVSFQFAAVTRHSDNHVILVAWSETGSSTADLRVWDITLPATITEKTAVQTNLDATIETDLFIDQATDDLYVMHLLTSGTAVRYNKSTDGGATWGANTAMADTEDNHLWVRTCPSSHPDGGRFIAVWNNADLLDLITNKTNSIETEGWTPPGGTPLTGASAQRGKFQVLADWSGDVDFLDANEDITADVRSMHIEHVRDYQTDYIEAKSLSLVMNNEDHKYSPPKGTITGLAAV